MSWSWVEVQLTSLLRQNEVLTLAERILFHLIIIVGVVLEVGHVLVLQVAWYQRRMTVGAMELGDFAEVVVVIKRIPVEVSVGILIAQARLVLVDDLRKERPDIVVVSCELGWLEEIV